MWKQSKISRKIILWYIWNSYLQLTLCDLLVFKYNSYNLTILNFVCLPFLSVWKEMRVCTFVCECIERPDILGCYTISFIRIIHWGLSWPVSTVLPS